MHISQLSHTTSITTVLSVAIWLLFVPHSTSAFFTDAGNMVDAGVLQTGTVMATISADNPNQDLLADTATSVVLDTDNTGTVDTQSRLTFTPQSCRTDFYTEILLEVTTASGTTAGTFADVEIIETDIPDTYTLDVIASANLVAPANETCVITATLETWQAVFPDATAGFSSVAQVDITLTTVDAIGAQETTSVVLNEIYPAILAGTTTVPLDREWVELYNGTGVSVDVAGWRIDEFISGDTANASRPHTIVSSCASVTASDHMQPFGTNDTVIPAGGFLVVEFCGSAPYLADGGDTVQLYNDVATLVDTHTYPATANGKSHARIPDGSAWVDPVPTPGNKNTATRADLEAEGWNTALIDSTLAKLGAGSTTTRESEHHTEIVVVHQQPDAVEDTSLGSQEPVGTTPTINGSSKSTVVTQSTAQNSVSSSTNSVATSTTTTVPSAVGEVQSTSTTDEMVSTVSTDAPVDRQDEPITTESPIITTLLTTSESDSAADSMAVPSSAPVERQSDPEGAHNTDVAVVAKSQDESDITNPEVGTSNRTDDPN